MGSPELLVSQMVPAYFDVVRSIFYHRFLNFTGFGGKMTMSSLRKPEFDYVDLATCGNPVTAVAR